MLRCGIRAGRHGPTVAAPLPRRLPRRRARYSQAGVDIPDHARRALVQLEIGRKVGVLPEDLEVRLVPHFEVQRRTSSKPYLSIT